MTLTVVLIDFTVQTINDAYCGFRGLCYPNDLTTKAQILIDRRVKMMMHNSLIVCWFRKLCTFVSSAEQAQWL